MLLLLMVGLTASGTSSASQTSSDPDVQQSRSGEALWGFYIYMAADNSLWEEAEWDLNEMKRIGSRPGLLEIVTLTDYQERTGYKDEADIRNGTTRAYHVLKGQLEQTPLDELNPAWNKEVDMGKGESLSSFLTWATTAYPAQNRVLVIWDHGKGWKKVAEDSGGSYLTMQEISGALDEVGVNFTMIGFDACLMAQTEIVHTLAPYTELVIGSQAYEPALGWTYDTMLGSLLPDLEQLESEEVARRLIHNYVESYRNGSKSSDYSVTYSAVAVEELARLETAIEELAWQLRNVSRVYRAALLGIRDSTQTFHDNDFLDLYDLSQQVAQRIPIPQVKAAALQVQTAVENAVVAQDHWFMPNRRDVTDAHGLSLYFPDNSIKSTYFDLSFTHGSYWPQFLDEFFDPKPATGELEAARATPIDLDENGYDEVLKWEANYTLEAPGGHLMVQVLDKHMGLVSFDTLDLVGDQDNLTGGPVEVVRSGDYHLQFLLFDDDGHLADVVNQGPYSLDLRLPDLALTQLSVRYQGQEVSGLVEGDEVSIMVQVDNLGTVASPPSWMNLTVNGQVTANLTLASLEPGAGIIRNVAWEPLSDATFLIEGRVEAEDMAAEANPLNNLQNRSVKVHPTAPSPFSPDIGLSLLEAPDLLANGTGFAPARLRVTLTDPVTSPFDLMELEGTTPSDWEFDLPDAPILVNGGDSVELNLSLRVPLPTVAGDYEVQLTAVARDGTTGTTASLMIPVPGYTGASLSAILDRPNLEIGGSGQVLVTIINMGNQPAKFSLRKVLVEAIDAPILDSGIDLGPFENTTMELNLTVEENLAPGDYILHLTLSERADQREIVSLNLTLPVGEGDDDDDNGLLTVRTFFLVALAVVVVVVVFLYRHIPGRRSP